MRPSLTPASSRARARRRRRLPHHDDRSRNRPVSTSVRAEFFHHRRGIPLDGDRVGDVLGYDRSGRDDDVVSDGHAGSRVARPPIQTSSPTETGLPYSGPATRSVASSRGRSKVSDFRRSRSSSTLAPFDPVRVGIRETVRVEATYGRSHRREPLAHRRSRNRASGRTRRRSRFRRHFNRVDALEVRSCSWKPSGRVAATGSLVTRPRSSL